MDLSIVIPVYNAERWIEETIRSIEPQLCDGIEVIVVNDGSTDHSEELIRQFSWVHLHNQVNGGCSAARTKGTELSSGRYIKYLDADDLILGGLLARQIALADSSGADAVYGNWQRLEQSDSGKWVATEKICRTIESLDTDQELAFFKNMWCPTASYLWRSSFLRERHPGWHQNLPIIQDARFAIDAANAGCKFVHDDNLSALYRTHRSESVSTRSRDAFLDDIFNSTLEIESNWRRSGKLTNRRYKAICDTLASLARNGSSSLSKKAFCELSKFNCKKKRASGSRLNLASSILGFRNAVLLARFVDRVCGR